MTDHDDDFVLEYAPTKLSRSLIALDPAVTTPECEHRIDTLRVKAQQALLKDITSIRSLFEEKREHLRKSYEASLKLVDEAEVASVKSYFESMFDRNQSWASRMNTLVKWVFGYTNTTKVKRITQ